MTVRNGDRMESPSPSPSPSPSSSSSPSSSDDGRRNISRYGRTRKQKTITDFLIGVSYEGQKAAVSKKSPDKNGDEGVRKVYIRKDLIQKKGDEERTASLIRSMFSPNKKEQADLEKKEEADCGWSAGELAWARVGGYPMWPCLVTGDANGRFVRRKTAGRSCASSFALHVTFFGDNGRHSWVATNLLMPFRGLDEFDRIKSELTPELRKRDPKYCASFDIKPGKRAKWSTAVGEAEMLLRRPPELRETFLINMLPSVSKVSKRRSASVGRRKKRDSKPFSEDGQNSLSESLFDSLFTEDENKRFEKENGENGSEVDLSEIALTVSKNISQTHMDRWLLKAKTPIEKENDSEAETSSPIEKSSASSKRQKAIKKKHDTTAVIVKQEIKSDGESDEYLSNGSEIFEKPTVHKGKEKRKRKNKTENEINDLLDDDSLGNSELSRVKYEYDDDGFKQFLSDRRESLVEGLSDVSENTIMRYLYRVWQYKVNGVSEGVVDNSDIVKLVKSMINNGTPPPLKKSKKTFNRYDLIVPNERPLRKKTIKSYFQGTSDSSDYSSDLENSEKDTKSYRETSINETCNETLEPIPTVNNATSQSKPSQKSVIDARSEMYMESLKISKPNIFKGILKGKVCEICESPGNLVKCNGPCQGFFHTDCVKKRKETGNVFISVGSSKKKRKKGRGRVASLTIENVNNSQSFPNSVEENLSDGSSVKYERKSIIEPSLDGQVNIPPDLDCIEKIGSSQKSMTNSCDKLEVSFDNYDENVLNNDEFGNLVVLDQSFADFENEMSQKIFDSMENEEMSNHSSSSNECRDWNDVAVGECVIVDARIVERKQKTFSNSKIENAFKCDHCSKYDIPLCTICKRTKHPKTGDDFRQRCSVIRCHQFYHLDCLKAWPQTKYSAGALSKGNKKESLSCPRHVCHTCVSDDPQGCKTRFSGDKLARCVKCPATYHCFTQCIPAGTKLLTASHIICPRHVDLGSSRNHHVNTAWCFICAKGGTLVCCETCPTSFHAECLNIPLPEGGYICEDCETGRLPLYEELVWVKLGQYRWWPAIVLHPSDIPPNINALPHKPGQFAVRFFGVYDHYWVNSGRVFPYQEGDTGHASSRRSSLDNAFLTAVKQAEKAYPIIKEIKEKNELKQEHELSSSLLPPKYIKLKVNRAIGGAIAFSKLGAKAGTSKCDCDPNSDRPCAPETDCLNRMLLTECSPSVCSAGDRCCNQAFEKRLYPPLEPSRTMSRGWGLKTLTDIKKGDFVIEYVGEVIDEEEFQRRMKRRQEMRDENYYFLTLDKDRMIDAGPKGNVARFMNHSCEPNCETQKWTVNGDTRVGLFALKDICAGTEVTFNYNLVCVGDFKKKCLCSTPRCAGYIGAKPKQEEPVPKKPKKTPKRKQKRKSACSPITTLKTEISKIIKVEEKEIDNLLEPEGIDLDVAIINKAVSDLEAGDFGKIENEIYPEKDDRNMEVLIKYESSPGVDKANNYREASPNETNYRNMNGSLKHFDNKKVTNKKGLFVNKKPTTSPPAKIIKRRRSNSVHFRESVTVINCNKKVSVNQSIYTITYDTCIPISQQNGHSEIESPCSKTFSSPAKLKI